MKKNKRTDTQKVWLTAALGAAAACGASAYEVPLSFIGTNMPPLEFHGFASQGFLYSGDYNYLANDTKNGSFQFSEFGLNASMNPFPHTRIAVQGFAFDVGNVGQYQPFLDYGLIEYTVNDELGIRAGRVRRAQGIYNAVQDIDLARTYVLLPQGMYDARWRDWSASIDGVNLFGEISLQKAGSLSYEAYAGFIEMANNGGVARYVEALNNMSVSDMNYAPSFGGQLWYNTPLEGLRFGAAIGYMSDFGFSGNSETMVQIAPRVYVPGYVNSHTVGNSLLQQYSVEYIWKSWTFQAEYSTYDLTGYTHANIYIPAIRRTVPNLTPMANNPETWYVAASHRFNKHIEAGAYYTQFTLAGNRQNDATLSLRFDIKDWWLFKVEGHCIQGNALLRDGTPFDNNKNWFMLAVKTTLSF